MSTSTGVNRGGGVRGRGGQRGGTRGSTGGANGVPLAAQMKQLQRLDEPKELALFRRFKDLGVTQVKSVYGPSGLLDQKLCVPSTHFRPSWGLKPAQAAVSELSLLQGEQILASLEQVRTRERLESRREARLGSAKRTTSLSALSADELDRLALSNAEYARRFPASGKEAGDGAGGAPLATKK